MVPSGLLTLTTDFGLDDLFVGMRRGFALGVCRQLGEAGGCG